MYQTITLKDFIKENKDELVKGSQNIIKAQKLFYEIKNKNIKNYRERMRELHKINISNQ